ncbi:MAG: SAM-dependent chlorinase/fluorinase [Sphingobacteriales bacterium JAD_PAG50586_3]|nr:MAG: SAM-dependent chlorinase/fluorinase [Sphingobacteriales bacterium JAD_PAG50586_3]
MAAPLVTLTSDLGTRDFYVGAVKGALLNQVPGVQIVDITHDIQHYNIMEAAFVVRNAYPHFPEGTVHVVAVRNEYSKETPHVACIYFGHIFIGTDSGIFSMIFEKEPDIIIELPNLGNSPFAARDVFVPAIAKLNELRKVDMLGTKRARLNEATMLRPTTETALIRGTIIYVDNFGNAITNIKPDVFERIGKGRPFEITFRGPEYTITRLNNAYGDVPPGELTALFGISGYLEIAINQGNASKLLGLRMRDPIRIEFAE